MVLMDKGHQAGKVACAIGSALCLALMFRGRSRNSERIPGPDSCAIVLYSKYSVIVELVLTGKVAKAAQ